MTNDLPTQAGAYLDSGADVWILTEDAKWYDCEGTTVRLDTPGALDWLKENGPYTPVPEGTLSSNVMYRVSNKELDYESEETPLIEVARLWIEQDGDVLETITRFETKWKVVRDA